MSGWVKQQRLTQAQRRRSTGTRERTGAQAGTRTANPEDLGLLSEAFF